MQQAVGVPPERIYPPAPQAAAPGKTSGPAGTAGGNQRRVFPGRPFGLTNGVWFGLAAISLASRRRISFCRLRLLFSFRSELHSEMSALFSFSLARCFCFEQESQDHKVDVFEGLWGVVHPSKTAQENPEHAVKEK